MGCSGGASNYIWAPPSAEGIFSLREGFAILAIMFKPIRQRGQSMFETHIEDLVRPDHPYRKLLNVIDRNVLKIQAGLPSNTG